MEKNLDDIIVGRIVKKLRRDRELSQAHLAEALGLRQNVISRIELGSRQANLGELRVICKCLGVLLSDFVQEYESRAQDR